MNKITLSEKVANDILAYLDTKSHKEVRTLIDSILKEAQEQANPSAIEQPVEEVVATSAKKAIKESK